MNILDNIAVETLHLRPFVYEKQGSTLGEFPIAIPVHKIYGPDPAWSQYSPYQGGYDISFIVSTTEDLTELVNSAQMIEVIAVGSCERVVQIGSSEGFKIASIKPPSSADRKLRSYQFQTVKPNKQPFINKSK